MKRNQVTVIATAVTLTLAASAAFAQAGPDFSPMRPGNYDELRTQSSASTAEQSPPAAIEEAPATPPQNRMLDAYESPAVGAQDTYAAPTREYRSGRRATVAPPRQSTIGNGLFDRRGPNDFGA